MTDNNTLNEIIKAYQDLLIVQYNDKPKAKATIAALVNELLANGIYFDVQNAFNIDTAIGKQLDILGYYYIGVNRDYNSRLDLTGDYFAFSNYGPDVVSNDVGFGLYDGPEPDQGLWLRYEDDAEDYKLNDDDYRFVLKLKIVQNNSNHSRKSIDDMIYQFFGDDLFGSASSAEAMVIYYFAKPSVFRKATIAYYKGALPKPMGVRIGGLIEKKSKFFAFKRAGSAPISTNVTGFKRAGIEKEGQYLSARRIFNPS